MKDWEGQWKINKCVAAAQDETESLEWAWEKDLQYISASNNWPTLF